MCDKLKEIVCPKCKTVYKPKPGVSTEDYIKSLTTNFLILQNLTEEPINYERRSKLYKRAKQINKDKQAYSEMLISEVDNEDDESPICSIIGTILKSIVFTVPFFLMFISYCFFVLFFDYY